MVNVMRWFTLCAIIMHICLDVLTGTHRRSCRTKVWSTVLIRSLQGLSPPYCWSWEGNIIPSVSSPWTLRNKLSTATLICFLDSWPQWRYFGYRKVWPEVGNPMLKCGFPWQSVKSWSLFLLTYTCLELPGFGSLGLNLELTVDGVLSENGETCRSVKCLCENVWTLRLL